MLPPKPLRPLDLSALVSRLHFLADPTEREALRQDGRFVASPHHGDRGWFGIRMEGDLDWKELTELLDSAYQQVALRRVVDS